MAFDPRGTNYAAMLRQRADADRGLTDAKRRKGERDREARVKESGKRSFLQKGLSAAARGGLAWATGGASELYGGGDLVDEVMLGTDSTGRPVRNEYGQLIKAGSGIYHGMKGQKAADIAGKRARNLQDYKNKVDLAEKMGVLDKEQGAKMLLSAEELRSAQQGQTSKADKRGVWGWDNEYDPLELSSSVLKGKDVADKIVEGEPDAPSVRPERYQGLTGEELDKGGKEQREQDLLRSSIRNIEPERDRGPSGEELDKGGIEQREQDLLRSRIRNIEPESWKGMTGEELDKYGKDIRKQRLINNQLHKERMTDRLLDREYNKKLYKRSGDYLEPAFGWDEFEKSGNPEDLKSEPYLGYEDWGDSLGRQELGIYDAESLKKYEDAQLYGKTYSEKEAEKLSEKDSGKAGVGTLDDMAIDERVKNLKKQDWWDRTFKRSDEDDQLLLEDRIKSERALKKKLATQPKSYGRADYEGSLYRPFESALKKRLKKKRQMLKKRGGINVS